MSGFVALARVRGVARVTSAQLLARLPFGMLQVVILLHAQAHLGGYGIGGLVLSCYSLGQAVSGPFIARRLVKGPRVLLALSSAVCSAAMVALAVWPPSPVAYMILGAVIGVSVPPVLPAVRALYPRLVPADLLHRLFLLDTTGQEVLWVVGPILATVLAATGDTQLGLFATAGILIAGTIWLIAEPALKLMPRTVSAAKFGHALRHGPVALGTLTALLLVASFGALEVGVLARADGDTLLSGVILAANALGSMVGGLVFGRRVGGRGTVVALVALTVVFTAASIPSPAGWPLGVAVFLAGAGFAPATALLYSYISVAVPEHQTPEAFGWLTTAILVGSASGTAIAGVAADHAGAAVALIIAAVFAALALVVTASAKAWYPRTRSLPRRDVMDASGLTAD